MKINQAFEILKKYGDVRAARIITDKFKKLSWWRVWFMAHQLNRGMPVAKIVHQKWFYGLPFYTNRHTLDPRPDTETIVAAVISDNPKCPKILDLGTGTGCIISALAKNIPGASGVGIEKSFAAARIARRNIKNLKLESKVKILHGSFANPNLTSEKFDVIVSNPPYIADGDKRVNSGAKHDPKIALYAKNNGLAAYEHIARNATKWIKPNARIYLEIGAGQAPDVKKIFENNKWQYVRSDKDLCGITRVLVFKN
ncbi:MAG: peptide chain release factor N(5)-glutamine methyltransferase [Alphaproteobacteria bacterium]|nr:peptide chain release factor N(5)-glutamine methyltransferase [Alphaproteobacteria bacterium]